METQHKVIQCLWLLLMEEDRGSMKMEEELPLLHQSFPSSALINLCFMLGYISKHFARLVFSLNLPYKHQFHAKWYQQASAAAAFFFFLLISRLKSVSCSTGKRHTPVLSSNSLIETGTRHPRTVLQIINLPRNNALRLICTKEWRKRPYQAPVR